jgi:hypothetical protein
VGFFYVFQLITAANRFFNQMKTNSESKNLAGEQRLIILAHLYLELRLPPEAAVRAATADLRDLDGFLRLEEAS